MVLLASKVACKSGDLDNYRSNDKVSNPCLPCLRQLLVKISPKDYQKRHDCGPRGMLEPTNLTSKTASTKTHIFTL